MTSIRLLRSEQYIYFWLEFFLRDFFILLFSFGDVQVGTITFFLFFILKWCTDGCCYPMLEV